MNKLKTRKKSFKKLLIFIVILSILLIFVPKLLKKDEVTLPNLNNMTIGEIKIFATKHKIKLNIDYQYSHKITKDKVIHQNIKTGDIILKDDTLNLVISKGMIPLEYYRDNKINELGRIPVMMYHNIMNVKNEYTGGNIDKDGYNRTSKAFREDLEYYYEAGYEMIRLIDYINGDISTSLGKSPIVLTFDDGNSNNIKVTGLDKDGNIIIDPESAVGILEAFKKKYPKTKVTATFFVNEELFNQSKYNEKILAWLINNGYDIGNHTLNHADFSKITAAKAIEEVGGLYNLLDKYIKDKYIKVVALPYGSPYKESHDNFKHILTGTHNGVTYETVSTLRVGWEADYSPFSTHFNQKFIKRIRAYDNNGKEFDIKMSLENIKDSRYISDGDNKTVVIPSSLKQQLNSKIDLEVIEY